MLGYMIYHALELRAQFGVECNNSKNPVAFSVSFKLEAEALNTPSSRRASKLGTIHEPFGAVGLLGPAVFWSDSRSAGGQVS